MKNLTLILIVALTVMLVIPAKALAIGLSVQANVGKGASLGPQTTLDCDGYNYNPDSDPWTQPACPVGRQIEGGTTLTFQDKARTTYLDKTLYDSAGNGIGGADCFYGANFYIVYLYPDAWGGAGYQLTQTASVPDVDIGKALVFTPVYSDQDEFCWGPLPQTCETQGALDKPGEEAANPQLTPSVSSLAIAPYNNGLILKAGRARVVRAEYGIPPKPGIGETRPAGWVAIPLTKTAATYSGSVTITLTELPTFP